MRNALTPEKKNHYYCSISKERKKLSMFGPVMRIIMTGCIRVVAARPAGQRMSKAMRDYAPFYFSLSKCRCTASLIWMDRVREREREGESLMHIDLKETRTIPWSGTVSTTHLCYSSTKYLLVLLRVLNEKYHVFVEP